MSNFINVAAYFDDALVPTKKALKEAVAEHPHNVQFESTSFMGTSFRGSYHEIPRGAKLQVCGPDPWNKRSWYATVTQDGKVT